MSETITVPSNLFMRMLNVLEKIEPILIKDNWINKEDALKLLGCQSRKLSQIKGSYITYKACGKEHQYCRKSIDKYNKLMSSEQPK